MSTTYPSIPIPAQTLQSMYTALLAMRQVISLLQLNQSTPTGSALSKGSQTFATTDHVKQVVSSIPSGPQGPPGEQGLPGPVGPPSFPDAPTDGKYYARVSASWGAVLPLSGGVLTGPIVMPIYTIATLPVPSVALTGARACVSDGAASPVFLGALGTSASTFAPVFCNGSAWVYG
jgi:hypothetical protein